MEVSKSIVDSLNVPSSAKLIAAVSNGLFKVNKTTPIDSPEELDHHVMALTEQAMIDLDDFPDEPTEKEVIAAYNTVSRIVNIQNASVPFMQLFGKIKVDVELDYTDTILCGIYTAAYLSCSLQMDEDPGISSQATSRRQFIQAAATMYDLSNVHIRNSLASQEDINEASLNN